MDSFRFEENKNVIYVLALESNRYYVGKTVNVFQRFFDHALGDASQWTKLYPPIRVVEIRTMKSDLEEDLVTKEYMMRYGLDFVRGGSYVALELDDMTRNFLSRELRGGANQCFRCGANGHMIAQCPQAPTSKPTTPSPLPPPRTIKRSTSATTMPAQSYFYQNPIDKKRKYAHNEYEFEFEDDEDDEVQFGACFRCGRTSHYAYNCYAEFHANGRRIFN
eukprot:TRINITY_DN19059_c0_g1_i1.p1 TRINITY_DN19059_c0_g1~~TRINITY_DN19059_c0_g1_i1.p1  ORF type:complete len:220 (-),score=17.91 TRINITY_DN19059_c0_g1_i1:134-793(-)